MSEISTFLSGSPSDPAAPGTLGRPQPGRRVAILGEDGTPVPLGEDGTIAVNRADPGLMRGYLNAPEASAARMSGDWFLTGDLGRMDERRRDHLPRTLGRHDERRRLPRLPGRGRGRPVGPARRDRDRPSPRSRSRKTPASSPLSTPAPNRPPSRCLHWRPNGWPVTSSPASGSTATRCPRNSNGKLQRPALRALWEKTP